MVNQFDVYWVNRHNFDHQLTVKGQIRFRVFGKKSGSGKCSQILISSLSASR